jgi:hypothetical protein
MYNNIFIDIIQKYKNAIGLVTTLIVVGLIAIIGVTLYQRAGKIAYTLTIVPEDSIVKMNDIPVSSGTYYLVPGQYTVIASHEGFANYKKIVNVGEKEHNTLSVPLIPISKEALAWAKEHKDLYTSAVSVTKTNDDTDTNLLKTQNPITDRLPFQNLLYSINYHADPTDPNKGRIVIDITADKVNRPSALFQIRQWGYDPTDYKIEFSGYSNPFSS